MRGSKTKIVCLLKVAASLLQHAQVPSWPSSQPAVQGSQLSACPRSQPNQHAGSPVTFLAAVIARVTP